MDHGKYTIGEKLMKVSWESNIIEMSQHSLALIVLDHVTLCTSDGKQASSNKKYWIARLQVPFERGFRTLAR